MAWSQFPEVRIHGYEFGDSVVIPCGTPLSLHHHSISRRTGLAIDTYGFGQMFILYIEHHAHIEVNNPFQILKGILRLVFTEAKSDRPTLVLLSMLPGVDQHFSF